jgi:SEC-C motif-containing protein
MKFDKCPCGSGTAFEACCNAIINGRSHAETAEQLMRSRYTAYMLKNVDYLMDTTYPESRSDDLESSTRKWMRQVEWLKLHIVATEQGLPGDEKGYVEFIAEYLTSAAPGRHHECSVFKKVDGDWFYFGEDIDPDA